MFGPLIWTLTPVEVEQTSPIGSASLIKVSPPLPSLIVTSEGPFSTSLTPLVWPETRLMAPGDDGPKVVS